MLKPGLVSITFRQLTPEEIVALAAQAGLKGIEWGGDVHVPHGDLARARHVRDLTRRAGLSVAAYGSYYRAAESEAQGLGFDAVLETARALDAPVIRVWAGSRASAEADAGYRARVAEELRGLVERASGEGRAVALEYHAHTLTDTDASAQQLLREVGQPGLRFYWQTAADRPHAERLAGLRALLPHLANLHVFHWRMAGGKPDRCPLAQGETEWGDYLRAVREAGHAHWLLLEFVRGDNPAQLLDDAQTLRRWLGEDPSGAR